MNNLRYLFSLDENIKIYCNPLSKNNACNVLQTEGYVFEQ